MASNMALNVFVRCAGATPSRSSFSPSLYSLELNAHWKINENIMASMAVMKEAIPKLMSLYVAVFVGLKSLPFMRWKINYDVGVSIAIIDGTETILHTP